MTESVVERFYKAFLAADENAIRETFAADGTWYLGGRSKLAGEHTGPDGVISLRRLAGELSGGTLRALRETSMDVAASPHHVFVHDVLKAERNGRELASHIALVAHVGKDGKVAELFTYWEDQYAFDDFFS